MSATWHSYSINTSRSVKSGSPNREATTPTAIMIELINIIPSYTTHIHSLFNIWKENREGGEGLVSSLYSICFPGTTCLGGYISLHLLVLLRFNLSYISIIPSSPLFVFFFYFLFLPFSGSSRMRKYLTGPIGYPLVHCLSFFVQSATLYV